jgi:hypothetical protein
MVALGSCLYVILKSSRIGGRFKSDILEIAMTLCRHLQGTGRVPGAAEAMRRSVVAGGYRMSAPDPEYLSAISAAMRGVDHPIRFDLRDTPEFRELIASARPVDR